MNIICVDASPTEGMNAAECFFENVSVNSSYAFLLQKGLSNQKNVGNSFVQNFIDFFILSVAITFTFF